MDSLLLDSLLDNDRKIIRWPKKKDEKLAVLQYLKTKLNPGIEYTEKEINAVIISWHIFMDFTLLRREMIVNGLLERTPDCRKYWIPK